MTQPLPKVKVVMDDGSEHYLDGRLAKMVLHIIKRREQILLTPNGNMTLSYSGNSVKPAVTNFFDPDDVDIAA